MKVMDAAQSDQVYQSGAGPATDSGFAAGALRHLVVGRGARLLDPRRTPVQVTAVDLGRGYFEVEILAFEDAGARWLVPLESVHRYQFEPGPDATRDDVTAMREVVAVLNRPFTVPVHPDSGARSLRRLGEERALARRWLDDAGVGAVDLEPLVRARSGEPAFYDLLTRYLREHGLADLEAGFTGTFVSNPWSGEVVKGHAIVLAELGLCAYTGTVVRDPALFTGAWTRERRGLHLLTRMAFVQALLTHAGPADTALFRGFSVDGPLAPRPSSSFVSATFSSDVAMAHFTAGHPSASTGVLYRQPLPVDRLFMTFVETSAMNRQYREAEAVLIGDPFSPTF
jgi:hypothetical protein